jgi:cell division septal protein FtsQ
VVLGLSAALSHSYHVLLKARWLQVKEIQINGLHQIDRGEILDALGVPKGANVLSLKASQLAARLKGLSWLRSSVVRIDLPGRIVVEVVEKRLLAIVHANDSFLLDMDGELFARADKKYRTAGILLVSFSGMNFENGDFLPSRPFRELKELSSALEQSKAWLPLGKISGCSWDDEQGFVFRTAENHVTVQLGSESFDRRLERLRLILGALAERQWSDLATRIDLDYQNRAYVEGKFPGLKGV